LGGASGKSSLATKVLDAQAFVRLAGCNTDADGHREWTGGGGNWFVELIRYPAGHHLCVERLGIDAL
jgi:hypothetical protein